MNNYKELLNYILSYGERRTDRTGTGTLSVWGESIHFYPEDGFPLLPLRFISFKTVFAELMFFLRGQTNIADLGGARIWDAWADEDGDLGPIYGKQWRDWRGIDQIKLLIDGLIHDPFSRRHMVSAWNVGDLDKMALPPCHYAFQCHVSKGNLSMMVQMRSCDVVVGLPHNIACYALLQRMLCGATGYNIGELSIIIGDTHVYLDHTEAAWEMIKRDSLPLPHLVARKPMLNIWDHDIKDFELIDYKYHDKIKLNVSV